MCADIRAPKMLQRRTRQQSERNVNRRQQALIDSQLQAHIGRHRRNHKETPRPGHKSGAAKLPEFDWKAENLIFERNANQRNGA